MPKTTVLLYKENNGEVPLLDCITKQRADLPKKEIELAIRRMNAFKKDPRAHTHEE